MSVFFVLSVSFHYPQLLIECLWYKDSAYKSVSTSMQVDGYSLDAQNDRMEKYAEFNDMVIAGSYSDEGKSGKNIAGRTDFQRMLNDIAAKKDNVKFVLVFKLSRFRRNAADVLNSLQFMQDYGVNLICIEGGIFREHRLLPLKSASHRMIKFLYMADKKRTELVSAEIGTIEVTEEFLREKLYEIRGVKVMLDADLAEIYGYTTKAFNQQIKNNLEKFDDDFIRSQQEAPPPLRWGMNCA